MEQYRIYRQILCIDLRSFFASVECALLGLNPFTTPLLVADESRGGGSIVLAITPYLKKLGVRSRCRLYEVPKIEGLMIVKPRMRHYIEASEKIIGIFLEYVSKDDMHIYSIDETFLDLTPYMHYYQIDIDVIARRILAHILKETAIPATCGIGDNLLLSKLALDLFAKKSKEGIATLRYDDLESMLWPIKPLSRMWGIGLRMEKRLNLMNIHSIYDLAHASLKTLKRNFGVIGEELYYHAHGIDMSIISEPWHGKNVIKSVGLGQTLYRDYDLTQVFQILLEMCDELAEKLRYVKKNAKTLHLGVRYSKACPGGFSRQISFDVETSDPNDLLNYALTLLLKHYDDRPIRQVFLRAHQLVIMNGACQASLFEDVIRKEKRLRLWETIDHIKQRFGKKSIARLSSHLEEGTYLIRSDLIGGHHG